MTDRSTDTDPLRHDLATARATEQAAFAAWREAERAAQVVLERMYEVILEERAAMVAPALEVKHG